MSNNHCSETFHPDSPDAAGIVSWVHIGDLHMTRAGQQNDIDSQAIVSDLNEVFLDSVSFVYLPGDVADDGSSAAYSVVRKSLDRLKLPWCAIVGDHDVHEKSFTNFLASMAAQTHYAFTAGNTRFVAMNAFDVAHPGSFAVLPDQMQWVEQELKDATAHGLVKVLLLHYYPSDLKVGCEALTDLVKKYSVYLIDMGHTHYNELGNNGQTIYAGTRSPGQIEEGPVGFSVTNLDGGGKLALPGTRRTAGRHHYISTDKRLLTASNETSQAEDSNLRIRAKVWLKAKVQRVQASIEQLEVPLRQIANSRVWEATVQIGALPDGLYPLHVTAEDADGNMAEDEIRISVPPFPKIGSIEIRTMRSRLGLNTACWEPNSARTKMGGSGR